MRSMYEFCCGVYVEASRSLIWLVARNSRKLCDMKAAPYARASLSDSGMAIEQRDCQSRLQKSEGNRAPCLLLYSPDPSTPLSVS